MVMDNLNYSLRREHRRFFIRDEKYQFPVKRLSVQHLRHRAGLFQTAPDLRHG